MAIRYDKKLNSDIAKLVKNFNAKRKRLIASDSNIVIPDKISAKDIKANAKNRRTLLSELNRLAEFNKRGSEKPIEISDVSITKWEYSYIKRKVANLKRSQSLKIRSYETLNPTILGVRQVTSFAKMGDDEYLKLVARRKSLNVPIKNLSLSSFRNLRGKIRLNDYLQSSKKTSSFRNSYYQMLEDVGQNFNYDNNKFLQIRRKLDSVDDETFLKIFRGDKGIQAIIDYYYAIGKSDYNTTKNDVYNLYDSLVDRLDVIIKEYA